MSETIEFSNEIPAGLRVQTDREKLELILRNLLINAASYSAPGAGIRVFATHLGDAVELGIENSVTDLDAADLPRMRERFWRKEHARSDTGHSGLGLPLVEALSGVLGFEVRLSLDERRVFCVVLRGLHSC